MRRLTQYIALTLAVAAAFPVSAREVLLFQPGQSSWEWLLVPSTHTGGKRMREGKDCLFCHEGEEVAIGNLIASGEKIEPEPLSGMPGYLSMDLDAAFDSEQLTMTFSWDAPVPHTNGVSDPPLARLTVMLGSDALSLIPIAGCWAACHNDLPGMPDAVPGTELSKYLPASRVRMSRTGGGTNMKGEAELSGQLGAGRFLEFIQVTLNDQGASEIQDGYFLQERVARETPAASATASRSGNRWEVTITRPMSGEAAGRVDLNADANFTIAVALHENHSTGRHHYTTFPMPFTLGGDGTGLNATQQASQ